MYFVSTYRIRLSPSTIPVRQVVGKNIFLRHEIDYHVISHTNIFLCKLQKYLFTLNRSIFLLSHAVTQNILVFWTVTVVRIKVFLFLSKCLSLSIPKYMLGKREKSDSPAREDAAFLYTFSHTVRAKTSP